MSFSVSKWQIVTLFFSTSSVPKSIMTSYSVLLDAQCTVHLQSTLEYQIIGGGGGKRENGRSENILDISKLGMCG